LGILNLSRAVELNDIRALATGTVSLSGPRASAGLFAKDETIRACDQISLSSRAEKELVTYSAIFVSVITVHTRAVGRRIGRLEFRAITAVDIEWIVTTTLSTAGRAKISKDKTVRAEFLGENKVVTFVIAIALSGIGENSVLLWTVAVLSADCNGNDEEDEEFVHVAQ